MERAAANQIFAQLLEKVTAVAARVPIEKVKLAIYVVLLLWVVDNLASLVWIVVPQPDDAAFVATNGSVKTQTKASQSANISKMQSWQLFGQIDATAVPEVEEVKPAATALEGIENDAVKTRLQLSLQGVVASSDPSGSRAMIEYQKKQEVYKIGDKLPVGKRVEIAKIMSDRVILDNGGRYELLLLYDEKTIARQAKAKRAPTRPRQSGDKVIDRRGEDRITQLAGDYRKQLISNPTSLADVIKVSVAKDADGAVMGYKIRPGKHREQFVELGLQSGDIVTEINGISLDNPTRALEVYRLLREAQEASFAIKRGDEDVSIIVGLGDG